jgi:hypothetical protein
MMPDTIDYSDDVGTREGFARIIIAIEAEAVVAYLASPRTERALALERALAEALIKALRTQSGPCRSTPAPFSPR